MISFPFTLTGTVEHGKALGNTYNAPTANITPAEDVSDLPFGVYYSTAVINGKKYPSITNLGVRPTVSNDGSVNAETFIYDYEGDLYGLAITVILNDFRRGEKKFSSTDELFATIDEDMAAGRSYHLARSSMASV